MNDINNDFGKGSVTRLGTAGGALVYEASGVNISYPIYNFPLFSS